MRHLEFHIHNDQIRVRCYVCSFFCGLVYFEHLIHQQEIVGISCGAILLDNATDTYKYINLEVHPLLSDIIKFKDWT